jgi:hypothetical protein
MKEKKNMRHLIAPCGIDCGICEAYLCAENRPIFDYLVSLGIPEDKLPCTGCRNMKGACPVIAKPCATFNCVEAHGVEYCFECGEFPCGKLHPAADRGDKLPHNLKIFNLCTIRRDGVEGFVKKSADIKKKYFKGKMVIGSGPKMET